MIPGTLSGLTLINLCFSPGGDGFMWAVSLQGFPGGSVIKNPAISAGDAEVVGSIPGWGRSPERGNGNPLQNSCWENPTDRGAWQATVCGVIESNTTGWLTHTEPQRAEIKNDKEANLGFIFKKKKVFHSCLLTVEKAVWGVGSSLTPGQQIWRLSHHSLRFLRRISYINR